MAERIDSLTPLHRRRVYPWAEWMDGAAWRIVRGEDFAVRAESMATMIRTRASASGMRAETRVVDDGGAVEFQFLPSEEAAA